MRADRAYLAGLGTTGVLVGSALLLLVVVGTLVAFHGWPSTDVAEDIGSLVVGDSERRLTVEDGPERIAAQAAPAAGAVAESAAPGTAAAATGPPARSALEATVPGRPSIPVPPRPPDGPDFPPDDPSPPPPPPPTGGGESASLLPQTPISAQVQRVTTGLGDTTQGLTNGLGQTVGGLSPPLGAAVVDTGRLLADLLRALGQPRR